MLTRDERKFLQALVLENIKHVRRENTLLVAVDVSFLKAEHQLEHFLVGLAKKLE